MAYAALISLKQIMNRLLNSPQISILPPSREIIEFAYESVIFLQQLLQRLGENNNDEDEEKVKSLNEQIREAAYKLEDAIEYCVSNQLLTQSESCEDDSCQLKLSPDLDEVKEEINSFIESVKMIEDRCSKLDLEESTPLSVPARVYFGGKRSKMVGLSDEFAKIRDLLLADGSPNRKTVSLVGMAGIGKTELTIKVYEDPFVKHSFDVRVWVTAGPKYQLKEILLSILAQMNYDVDNIHTKDDEELLFHLHRSLSHRRYLIVLDDVWNIRLWDELKKCLPDNSDGSRILLTTRLREVARYADRNGDPHQIRFLSEEESWDLLRERVFGEMLCPYQLEKAGKKIAKNCEGLPLAIVTVANLLQKSKKTVEYWNKAAEGKNSLFTDAYENISELLFPSYKYLPQHLKACFLYMGVFPPSSEIPASKIIKLWSAEGFLEAKPHQNIDDFALECLQELVSGSLVLVRQLSSTFGTKTCSLHSVFLHLCIREAAKEKFFHVLNSFADSLGRGRRLCVHNNILLSIKEVQHTMKAMSSVHSLLCTGPHHQFPVPIFLGFRFLKVLDALTIRWFDFPVEVLNLVQLRYLALTYNGKLPASISKLWKLQYLIVRRHLSIKYSSEAESYLPMDIWDMKELKHLQFMGSNIPDPCGALLPNLLTLSDVSADSCTKGVLERIPNLKKLGIQVEITPDAAETLGCFDHLSHLHGLESFKCVIVNPKPKSHIIDTPASTANFPPSIKKLNLSGLGYPWEYMSTISKMPNLEVLKLRSYAFQGPKWVTHDGDFERLQYLLIEDTDLEHWETDGVCFPSLERLIISHCYKLKDISWVVEDIYSLKTVQLVDCPSAVDSVMQGQGHNSPQVSVRSS